MPILTNPSSRSQYRGVRWASLGPALLGLTMVHLALESSSPEEGSTLETWPDEIVLTFTQEVQPGLSEASLRVGGELTALEMTTASADDTELLFGVPTGLPPGEASVEWTATGLDGHPVSGVVSFTVLPDPTAQPPATVDSADAPPPTSGRPQSRTTGHATDSASSPVQVAVRFASYVFMLGMLGAVGFLVLVAPADAMSDGPSIESIRRTVAKTGVSFGGVFGAALVGRLMAQTALLQDALSSVGTLDVLTSTWGMAWSAQALGALIAVVGLAGMGGRTLLAVVGSVLVAAASPLTGHAAAAGTSASVVDAVHILGAGIWIGGLGSFLIVLAPTGGDWERSRERIALLLPRFARVALWAGPLTVLSGATNAWIHAPPIAEWLSDPYGRLLTAKIILVGGILALGAMHHLKTQPVAAEAGTAGRFVRSGALELLLGLLAVAVTALLVTTAAAR